MFKNIRQIMASQAGMSLIEILIALTLLGLAGTFVAGKVTESLAEGQVQTAKIQIRSISERLKEFRRDCNFIPTTDQGLEALVEKPTGGRECKRYAPGGYIDGGKVPLDPWDGEYIYESDGKTFTIISYGSDNAEGGEGADADLNSKISNILKQQQGFSLIEILVALILASLVFLAVPSGDDTQKHRDLQSAVSDMERSMRFASNEAVLRNTVVRLRISMDKEPVEYNVEYGPPGNLPLPDMPEKPNNSLAEDKAEQTKIANLNKQFTKVEEFEDIRHELSEDVSVIGIATSFQKKILLENDGSIYFYPSGEKDAALVFLSTDEEIAYLEVQPFLSETRSVFETLKTESVAKKEDILQTRMDEVYKEWISH